VSVRLFAVSVFATLGPWFTRRLPGSGDVVVPGDESSPAATAAAAAGWIGGETLAIGGHR
jgi:hypothetical protein